MPPDEEDKAPDKAPGPRTGGLGGADRFETTAVTKKGSGLKLPGPDSYQRGSTAEFNKGPGLPPRPALGTGPLPSVAEVREQLDSYDRWSEALQPRLRFLNYVLDLHKGPAANHEAALAQLRADHAQMAEALLAAMQRDPALPERISLASDRVQQASTLADDAWGRLDRSEDLPDSLKVGAFKGFDFAAFKRAVFLMGTLDAHFAGVAVLEQLFPPVVREGSLSPDEEVARQLAARRQSATAPKLPTSGLASLAGQAGAPLGAGRAPPPGRSGPLGLPGQAKPTAPPPPPPPPPPPGLGGALGRWAAKLEAFAEGRPTRPKPKPASGELNSPPPPPPPPNTWQG